MKAFSIVVPHWGTDELLDTCLASLHPWSDWIGCVHVIDNNVMNAGFTRGCNYGLLRELAWPSSEHVLLLNNDCAPVRNPFAALYERLQGNRVGIVAPKNVAHDDHDEIIWGGSYGVLPGIHKAGSVRLGQLDRPTQERWATFSVVALKRKMLEQVGVLNASYRNFCSDADYCYRARARGWEVWYEPQSVWEHQWKASRNPGLGQQHERDAWEFHQTWSGGMFYQVSAYGDVDRTVDEVLSRYSGPRLEGGEQDIQCAGGT